ncbi:hypothetical protein [Pseudoalteromonas obscura]|uniref:Uncharacterized protein n=1 Tax=Pseudoalteromonas obscura TaxID=3048491 RepID=A0ABT7EJ43_9GAMM|nr:hypothetical protein [Pseudoalteromonas sp. P94(2023)]MDK2595043.1 hypothetical protein [Pseudoalteromonas sp. P94(2023)]
MQIKSGQSIDSLAMRQLASNAKVSKSEREELDEVLRSKEIATIEQAPDLMSFPFRAKRYQVINLSSPHEPPQYQYGELTNPHDIEAFLTHQDRLSKEQSDILRTYVPSKELLAVMDKMDDETLTAFVDVLSASFGLDSLFGHNKEKSQQLISLMSDMSEEQIKDTVDTLAHLSDKEINDKPDSPILAFGYRGPAEIQLHSFAQTADHRSHLQQSIHFSKLTHQNVDLLAENRYSEGDLMSINQHLQESSFEQSRGIIDMAINVKNNDRVSFLNMLDEVDKDSENNIFEYVGKQVDVSQYTSAYESSYGGYVLFSEKMASESQRTELYSNLIDSYDNQGVGLMEDVVGHLKDTPPQIQSNIWEALNETIENNPALFDKSDSIENWMKLRLGSFQRDFENKQVDQIYDIAEELDVPRDVGQLEWVKLSTLY